jgi:hypothetical protein
VVLLFHGPCSDQRGAEPSRRPGTSAYESGNGPPRHLGACRRPASGHENARRNRRSWAESPRASSGSLKASVHRPLRARPTMTARLRWWLPAYPRPSRFEGPNPDGFPPLVHQTTMPARPPGRRHGREFGLRSGDGRGSAGAASPGWGSRSRRTTTKVAIWRRARSRPPGHGNARRNQSVRWPVSANASTRDSVPSNPGP